MYTLIHQSKTLEAKFCKGWDLQFWHGDNFGQLEEKKFRLIFDAKKKVRIIFILSIRGS